MAQNSYVWRLYCVTEGQYVSTISDTEPTVCPNNPLHTIDPSQTAILVTNFVNIDTDSYINIQSRLADNNAIRINASDTNGGINVNAGVGGIAVNTTNAISMNANAASNLSTTSGNVLLQSLPALVDIDGGLGINIGCDNNLANTVTPIITPIVNVGTSASAKTINVGNTTGATAVNVNSGTGGITINSSTGQINIVGNNSGSNAINLDASSGTNGINMLAGSGGMAVNTGGIIALTTSGAIGLTCGGDGINLSGGNINVGHFGSGDVYVAADPSTAATKLIFIGNTQFSSSIIERWGDTGSLIQHQSTQVTLAVDATAITGAQLLVRIIAIDPTTTVFSLSLPTAADIRSAMNSISGFLETRNDDSIDFTIINTNASNALALTTGEITLGSLAIPASASGAFRLRITNATLGSETYKIYRLS